MDAKHSSSDGVSCLSPYIRAQPDVHGAIEFLIPIECCTSLAPDE